MIRPSINVTPLIDVLLVLLIIFMVVSPLKPSAFRSRIPPESRNNAGRVNDHALVVAVAKDLTLTLNNQRAGEIGDDKLSAMLASVFTGRIANGDVSESFADDPERPMTDRIERTVFIKAPRSLGYGSVVRVIDTAKLAGAYPISLQIDDLD